jgi:hypothetical protein
MVKPKSNISTITAMAASTETVRLSHHIYQSKATAITDTRGLSHSLIYPQSLPRLGI